MKENSKNIFKKICVVSLAAAMLMDGGLTEMGTYIGTAVQVSAVTSSSKETPASSFEYWENGDNGITITNFIGNEHSVIIPSKIDGKAVTSIGDEAFTEAFSDYKSLKEVTIPDSVTSIGNGAFNRCTSLTEVRIPDSVTSIGDSAFEYCGNLTEVTIPNSVTSIGDSTFDYCGNLTEVRIPDGVTSIGKCAFRGCTSLKEVTIPNSVTSIEWSAFNDRRSLKDVYYTGSKEEWKKIHIERNNSDLTDATIHYNCSIDDTSIYASNVNSTLSDNNDGSTSKDSGQGIPVDLNSSDNNNNSTSNNSSVTVIIVAGIGIIAVTAVIIFVKLKNKKQ